MNDTLLVKAEKTLITEVDIIQAVKKAYRALTGEDPTLDSLAILSAQIFFECGRGKACFNYNLGNIKRTKGHKYTMYRCSEYINKVLTYFDPPHPQTHFNSYDCLREAASEHLAFLNSSRYQAALQEAKNGNAMAYCIELKKSGYFTDNIEHYSKVLISIFNEIKKKYAAEAEYDPYEDIE